MKNKKTGFTLIEILMGFALLSVLLVTVNAVIFNSLKSARRTEATNKAKSEGALLIDRISKDIQFSQNISNCTATSLTLERPDLTTVTYDLNGTYIRADGANISSSSVIIRNHADCAEMFTCAQSYVTVCFGINTVAGSDASDVARSGGDIKFSNQVIRRNNI